MRIRGQLTLLYLANRFATRSLGISLGKARSGIGSHKPGDLLYFPGFERLGEGVVCTAQKYKTPSAISRKVLFGV